MAKVTYCPNWQSLFTQTNRLLEGATQVGSLMDTYSALRKYSAPLNFATFCHISGFKHKDFKLYFFCEESITSGTQS